MPGTFGSRIPLEAAGRALPGGPSQRCAGSGAEPAEHSVRQIRRLEVPRSRPREGCALDPATGRKPARHDQRLPRAATARWRRPGARQASDRASFCKRIIRWKLGSIRHPPAAAAGAVAGSLWTAEAASPPTRLPLAEQIAQVREFYTPVSRGVTISRTCGRGTSSNWSRSRGTFDRARRCSAN